MDLEPSSFTKWDMSLESGKPCKHFHVSREEEELYSDVYAYICSRAASCFVQDKRFSAHHHVDKNSRTFVS